MTDHLTVLVDRAARGVLSPAEGVVLRTAVRGLQTRLTAAEASVTRGRQLAAEMRTWCSPHGVAQHYADQLNTALDGPSATN